MEVLRYRHTKTGDFRYIDESDKQALGADWERLLAKCDYVLAPEEELIAYADISKLELKDWLTEHSIGFDASARKSDLYDIYSQNV